MAHLDALELITQEHQVSRQLSDDVTEQALWVHLGGCISDISEVQEVHRSTGSHIGGSTGSSVGKTCGKG